MRKAAAALRMAGPWAGEAVPGLVKVLQKGELTSRRYAAYALGKIAGPAAAGPLSEALSDSDIGMRYAAAQGLGLMGPSAAPAADALRKALRDESKLIRARSAEALGLADPKFREEAVRALRDQIRDTTAAENERLEAALALTRLDPAAAKYALPLLMTRVKDDVDPAMQVRVIEALVRMDKSYGERFLPRLREWALEERESGRVRVESARLLGTIDPELAKGRQVIGVLTRYAAAEDEAEQLRAVEALQAINPDVARRLGFR